MMQWNPRAVSDKKSPEGGMLMAKHLIGGASCRLMLIIALVWGGSLATSTALAQEQRIEEVIVTGTYIRRADHFDTATPIEVIDAVEIAESGRTNLGEVLRNTTYNYGVSSVNNILAATAQNSAAQAANLRGLGSGSTLTIMDGRRATSQNVLTMYPQIAVERLEMLTDGGAAIYGTDAVGGVLNVIPRRSFNGLEVRVSHNNTTEGLGDWGESTWSIIGGTSHIGDSSVVAALEYRTRDELQFMDRPHFALGAPSYSQQGNPGTWSVPRRDAQGNITGRQTINDPGCGRNNPPDGSKADTGSMPQGVRDLLGSCFMDFGANFNYMRANETWVGAIFLNHQVNEHLSLQGEIVFSRNTGNDRGSPQGSGGRHSQLPTVPGEHPGNPFRAMSAAGQLLYAEPFVDGGGNFILDRHGRPQPKRDPQSGEVVLAPNPTDPASGIPFNEDVRPANWRPLGFPQNSPSRSNRDRTGIGDSDFQSNQYRWVGQLDFVVPNTSWLGWVSYTFDEDTVDMPRRRESLQALSAGLQGTLVYTDPADGLARLGWYNPFSTQNVVCVNRDCAGGIRQEDPLAVNPTPLLDQIFVIERDRVVSTLNIADLVVTGNLFDLPAGTVGAAFGGQFREEKYDADYGAINNAFDGWRDDGRPDWDAKRRIVATFAEVNVPLAESTQWGAIDLNAAARFEWVSDDAEANLDSDDYKVSLRWGMRDWVALRTSWSTAFKTPTITELFGPREVNLSNAYDPFRDTGAFISRTLGGTANLRPQTATIWNVGLTLDFFDGDLTYAFDWKDFDFTDRIVRLVPEDVLRNEFTAYRDAGFPVDGRGVATEAGLRDWMNSAHANPGIQRDPYTMTLNLVVTPLINASSIRWQGFDTSVRYRFDGQDLPLISRDIGRFSARIEATYVHTYEFVAGPGKPAQEGAGKRNNATGFVPPTPRWRGNLRLGWIHGMHSTVIHGRYTHRILNDGEPFAALVTAARNLEAAGTIPSAAMFLGSRFVTNPHRDHIASHTEWDVQYRVDLDGLWGERRTAMEIGLINAFDKRPPRLMTLGGMETFLHDPRGRIWYVRASQEF
jgi:iron complex outermembrane recepter protein